MPLLTERDRITAFLSAYTKKLLADKFESVEEAQAFIKELLPKSREERHKDYYHAPADFKQQQINTWRTAGKIVYTESVPGQTTLRSMSCCSIEMWTHIKNDPGVKVYTQ